MKKEYVHPEIEIQQFVAQDILWSSNEGEWDIEGIRL